MRTTTSVGATDGTLPRTAVMVDDALFSKISWRLMPLLFTCFVFNYLARTNVGYAQLHMNQQLSFSDAVFGLGAGAFFIGYALFEVPSNLLLNKIGVRASLLRIMTLWGLTSAATIFVTTPAQYYAMRFLLGVFEAGFLPGILFYLTLWYPSGRRAQPTALFLMGAGAAPILAGPIAGLAMTYLDGVFSVSGWQWLFLVEGLPSVLLGVIAYFWLTNTPAQATWLTDAERLRTQQMLAEDQVAHTTSEHQTFGTALRDGRIWLLGAMVFLVVLGVFALSFWQPIILKSMGLTVLQIGFAAVIPASTGILAAILVGRHSDRTLERRWHFAIPAVIGATGLVLTTLFMHDPVMAILCLSLAAAGISSALTILWAVPGTFMTKSAAATGIAVIATVGSSAGAVAPIMVGYVKTVTGGFSLSLYILGGALVLAALLMLFALPKSALPSTHAAAR